MNSEEIRLILIRQTQAIRKALHIIECNLGYYERIVEEEQRAKAQKQEAPSTTEQSSPSTDWPNGSA